MKVKMNKKIISLLMVFCLLAVALSAQTVFATGETIVSVPGSIDAAPGETIDVPITLEDVPAAGIGSGLLVVTFDNTKMSFEGATSGPIVNSDDDIDANGVGNHVYLLYLDFEQSSSSHISSDGILATLHFTINENCPEGTYGLTVDKDGDSPAFYTPQFAGVDAIFNNGSIVVE